MNKVMDQIKRIRRNMQLSTLAVVVAILGLLAIGQVSCQPPANKKEQQVNKKEQQTEVGESTKRAEGKGGTRGLLGHYFGGIPDVSQSSTSGIRLVAVRPGSPAEEAGLQVGDIIVKLGEVTIQNLDDFRSALQTAPPGEPIEVVYIRQGKEYQTETTLKARR